MSNWAKRQAAGFVRSIVIGLVVTILFVILFTTGVLQAWLGDVGLGMAMFFNMDFWSFVLMMIMVIGITAFCIRTRFNWGGA